MTSKRENEFPATSMGRTSGLRLQAAAHEAHPLSLPGRPASPALSESSGTIPGGATLSVNGNPKYVPYTPRQRVAPTSATTATAHPPSPQQHQGDATSKLQLMHLKAAAQNIGLDSGTLGWSILEKLVLDCDYSEEWVEIYSAITSSKATLLLPLEPALTNEKITAEFVKDHIVLCEGPSRNNAQIVSLSGLRGTLNHEILTFRSTIHPTSKLFQDLFNPATKASALSLLPPLPTSLSDMTPPTYPQFIVPSYATSLVLPPRSQPATKPPLPPRPNNRPTIANSTAPPSRLTNTFASLFGGSHYAKPSNPPVSASPPASLHSVDSAQDSHAPVEVSAFTIDRRIFRKEIGREMNKILKTELKLALDASASLGNNPMPSWVVERVQEMTATWYPFVKGPMSSPSKKKVGSEKETTSIGYFVNPIAEIPDDAAERLQDFYLCLAQDMRVGGIPPSLKRREKDVESDVEDEEERDKREHDMMESGTRIRDVMEAVERTITSLFYDRLFMQSTTDDASHDEALSSRVAALKLLDLGLGHLGIETGEAINEEELDVVVKACGDMLAGLDSCRSPGEKAAILVAAHKIVVDGLSRLPPIRLVSENEATYQEDLDSGLATAEPTIVPAVNTTALQSAQPQVSSSETIPEASVSTIPPTPPIVNSPEASHLPLSKSNASSSRLNNVPSPLHLSPPVSSPGLSSAAPEVTSVPKEPTPVSGDVLLPLIIFSVVKCNPPHLVSNLLFTQRFRNQSVGGEESYCLINLMAVVEFLENVDMSGLGLGDSEKVMSTADLTPIPVTRSAVTSETPLAPAESGLRGRVEQQVDAIADSANKVISGVVDSSFGILRSFMPSSAPPTPVGNKSSPGTGTEHTKPGFNLLRRESGFSIASIAASLPIGGRVRSKSVEETGQQLITVSRPLSLRSKASWQVGGDGEESQVDDDTDESASAVTESDEALEGVAEAASGASDTKSIRSFEHMLSAGKEQGRNKKTVRARKSISDRLASVTGVAASKTSPSTSPRSSLLLQSTQVANLGAGPSSPPTHPISSPMQLRLAPPKKRFIECTPDDLRLSEVGELLREYRRLVAGIRAVGGFDV